jgi:hypothetical protein
VKVVDVLVDGVVWLAVLSTASGVGMLLSAMLDTWKFRDVGGP